MSKKEKLKVGEVLNIFNKLNTVDILQIKDTEFAKGVFKNMQEFVPIAEKADGYKIGKPDWQELVKDVKTLEELDAMRADDKNAKLFKVRDAEIEEYKVWLESDFEGKVTILKINNLNTTLSAEDLLILQNIIKL